MESALATVTRTSKVSLVMDGLEVARFIQTLENEKVPVTLGIGDEVGLIKKGYQADLMIIPGDLGSDPSAIKNVTTVFKKGIGYDPQKLIADVEGKVGLPE